MILHELYCDNFIKFKSPQTINFAAGKKHITFINGDGRAGKTTIFRAIRWALYGNTGDEYTYKSKRDLINNINVEEGNFNMKVALKIEKDKSIYEVERSLKLEKGKKFKQDQDLKDELFVTKDGELVEDPENEINDILDEDLSEFFLFDGEQLQKYQDLVFESGRNKQALKTKIEKAMRLPHLVNANKDLKKIRKDVDKKRDLEIDDEELKSMTNQLENLRALINETENSLEEFNKSIDLREKELEKMILKRNSFGDKNEKVASLNELKGSIPQIKKRQKSNEDNLAKNSQYASRVVLDLVKKKREVEVTKKTEAVNKESRLKLSKEIELEKLKESKESDICPFCEQPFTESEKKILSKKIDSLKKEIKDLNDDEIIPEPEIITTENLESLIKLNENVKSTISELMNAEINKESLENEIGNISGMLGDLQKEINEKKSEIENLNKEFNKKSQELDGGKNLEKIGKLYGDEGMKSAEEKLDSQIEKLRPNDSLKEKAIFINEICAALSLIKEEIETQVKEQVEEKANSLLDEMSENTDLKSRLEVNENYGLKNLDPFGNVVPESGTGNATIAYSLLISLKDVTNMKAPFIIDTPLGRISPNYKKKILATLPEHTQQLVLLVHDSEIKKGDELFKIISPNIGFSYKLDYKNNFESEISKL